MADLQPPSPRGQVDEGAASSSANVGTESTFGITYGHPDPLQSRQTSRVTTPLPSGRATPTGAPVQDFQDIYLAALRQGQADANASMGSMRSSQDELR
jgi:hypothetical protein